MNNLAYFVDDWRSLITDAFKYAGPPICPACPVAPNWNISIGMSLSVDTEFLGRALTGLWRPCRLHEDYGQLVVASDSEDEWQWGGARWFLR